MITLENVVRGFGARRAVDHLSFTLTPGKPIGFLGPNGAGKTTTMRLIIGFLTPDQGQVRVLEKDPAEDVDVRAQLGYLPEHNPLYGDMTVIETLETAAALRGLDGARRRDAVTRVLKQCRLTDHLKQTAATLSKGYKQRLGLAQALVHEPRVLILDEPTTGLDPNQIEEIRTLIAELGRNCTVLLSSHLLEQVTGICDRLLILKQGRLVFDGSLSGLHENAERPKAVLVELQKAPDHWDDLHIHLPLVQVDRITTDAGATEVRFTGPFDGETRAKLMAHLVTIGARPSGMRVETPSAASLFAQLTQDTPAEVAP